MDMSLVLDIVVALLLGAVVWHGVLLNNRLANLRAGHDELARLIAGLNRAIDGAQESVANLKNASESARRRLGDEISRAAGLRDELEIIVGSGNNLAARLESELLAGRKSANSGKPGGPADPGPRTAATPLAGAGGQKLGAAEEDILRALSGAR